MITRNVAVRYCGSVLLANLLCGQAVWGQEQTEKPNAAQAAEARRETLVEPKKPLRGPKYLNLRYDEDFSYLDGPEGSYQPDYFDRFKNIHIAEDWRLTLGGEFRFQMQSETNKGFGATEPANDTFTLYRYFVHGDFKFRDLFRVFVQGAVVHDEDRDLAPRGIDENIGDLTQLFFDLRVLGEEVPLTLRVGRQELQYGAQRFVSPLEWASIRRRFDAVKLFWKSKNWNIDAFYAKIVAVQRRQADRFNEDFDFYGLYTTYKGIPRHILDFYLFAIDNTGNPTNPNGKAGDVTRFTLGSRFAGKTAGFDYETELAGQWGRWAGDTIQAWSWSAVGGYTLDTPAKPRIGVGFDWATGDDDPTDGTVGTFDQMFPLGHAYLGFLDLVGRQNIIAANVNLSAWMIPNKVKGAMAYHAFWLADPEDSLFNAGARPGRRDPAGGSGREVGQELDLTVAWKLDVHSKLLFGYSHFWEGNFIINTGPSEDADLFYVQYQFKF
ncbi:MAG: alginate export family protein [Phycisphaerae bacterium]